LVGTTGWRGSHDGAGISPQVPENKAGKMSGQWPRIEARTGRQVSSLQRERHRVCSMTSQRAEKRKLCVAWEEKHTSLSALDSRDLTVTHSKGQGPLTWPPRQHPARSWANQGCFAMLVGVQPSLPWALASTGFERSDPAQWFPRWLGALYRCCGRLTGETGPANFGARQEDYRCGYRTVRYEVRRTEYAG